MSSLNHRTSKEEAFALIAVMLMMSVLLSLVGAYSLITRIELATNRSSSNSTKGFYAAEAALNVRAETVRSSFTGYNFPDGESPAEDPAPCTDGNDGDGDYACEEINLGGHTAVSYIVPDPTNPYELTVPPGERYQNLDADEYRYSVISRGLNGKGEVEAILELRFKTRLVPMFQFAAFYNKDLEINPGPDMALAGPVHTNGDLYLGPDGNDLAVYGQVTATGNLYRGRKDQNDSCHGNVYITYPAPALINVATPTGCSIANCQLNVCSGGNRAQVQQTSINKYNGLVQFGVPVVEVPEPEEFDPIADDDNGQNDYWEKADLRVVLRLDSGEGVAAVEVKDAAGPRFGTTDAGQTADIISSCAGQISGEVVGSSTVMMNRRESTSQSRILLEVDLRGLLDCLHNTNWLGEGKGLDDDTEDGLVLYFTVDGPNSEAQTNKYGVRIRNAAILQPTVGGAPAVGGLSIVSDQAIYTMGNYNSGNPWTRSAIFADSFNILSTAWNTATFDAGAYATRNAASTTVNAAILSGTDTTGGLNTAPAEEGLAGQNAGPAQTDYNGGLENYPRFHENWSGDTLNYLGSFVSLNRPRHVSGPWNTGTTYYSPPARNWGFDTRFNNSENLPPMTPRFVFLKQQLFLREFEQDS